MSFAITPKAKGDEDKVVTALRRLVEEDPTLVLRRDEQTGEQLLAGMSQMHVEVAVERIKRRFGAEVELHQPRVPYLETIRKESRAHSRYKKQTGGRGQFGDCDIVLEPLEGHQGYEFVDKIVGGVIPQSFRPAVDKGIQEAMHTGELAGAPVQGVRVILVDGSYHTVDSSEMAFKIAGSMAFKEAYAAADPVLLEPIMSLEVDGPRRRGRRRERRPELAPRTPARDGARRGDDDHQRRGADGRVPHLLPVADVAHRRPRRLRHELPPLRGSADARCPEDRRRDEACAGRGESVIDASRPPPRTKLMQIRRQEDFRVCAVCERTILQASARPATARGGELWVDVCPLCIEIANERGWVKEGSPTTPLMAEEPRHTRRRRFGGLGGLLDSRPPEPEPVVSEPVLRRLSPEEQHLVEAAELFNKSPYSRTIAGVRRASARRG